MYDPAGRLESTTGPDGTVTYSWDTNGNLTGTSAGDSSCQLGDRLGSVRTVTDETGAASGGASFYAYGETRSSTGAGGPLGYTGQYEDPTGLIHLRARQYNPALGQFLTVDPVQPNGIGTQGFGLHGYVSSRPGAVRDSSGRSPMLENFLVGSAVGGASGLVGSVGSCPPRDIACHARNTAAGAAIGGGAALLPLPRLALSSVAMACVFGGTAGVLLEGPLNQMATGQSWSDPSTMAQNFALGCATGVAGWSGPRLGGPPPIPVGA